MRLNQSKSGNERLIFQYGNSDMKIKTTMLQFPLIIQNDRNVVRLVIFRLVECEIKLLYNITSQKKRKITFLFFYFKLI
jgi:hypothetical protein